MAKRTLVMATIIAVMLATIGVSPFMRTTTNKTTMLDLVRGTLIIHIARVNTIRQS